MVRRITVDYLKPAFLDDALVMQSTVEELKNTSFTMHQVVLREKIASDGRVETELVCDMHVVLVCVDTENILPARLPEDIKLAFQNYSE